MIIGIGGKKRAGKSTLGGIFVKDHGFTEITFAGPIKSAVSSAFNISSKLLEDGTKDVQFKKRVITSKHIADFLEFLHSNYIPIDIGLINCAVKKYALTEYDSHRFLLQFLGTEVVRGLIDSNYWIKCAELQMSKATTKHVVFSDVRFKNELDLVTRCRGIGLYITRGNEQNNDQHQSENELKASDFSVTVLNDSDFYSLKSNIHLWFGMISRDMSRVV